MKMRVFEMQGDLQQLRIERDVRTAVRGDPFTRVRLNITIVAHQVFGYSQDKPNVKMHAQVAMDLYNGTEQKVSVNLRAVKTPLELSLLFAQP